MSRTTIIALCALVAAVIAGLLLFPGLRKRIRRLATNPISEEQARREVLTPPVSTPTDKLVEANIYWAASAGTVAPVAVKLPLSDDPTERSKQVLQDLISSPPTADQRTLPAETVLLSFYVLPDGTAVADFSGDLVSRMPSGILSEELAVDSITQTLAKNVSTLRRLKILIHGQEVETLAGHIDLTGFFDLNPTAPSAEGATSGNGPSAGQSSAAIPQPAISAPAATAPLPANSPAAPKAASTASTSSTAGKSKQ
jgi:hypothetical protein